MTLPGNLDTIVAIATPPGRGAVGIVRISGPAVPDIGAQLLGRLPAPRRAALRRFRDADGTALDEGLALYFAAPGSFTGEPTLELQGHGGAVVLDRVLQRALALGCRMARPGEFTERAFLNGKLDLAQAEAVADLIDAGSQAAAQAAVRSMRGAFSDLVRGLQAQLTELRIHVEAAIDFPDDEIDFLSGGALQQRLTGLFALFESITESARQGTLLREGLTVVIAGKPNAGKSSLLNRLVGDAVAIVTAVPGTTRDLLRHPIHLDGLPVNLIDTAGLRAPADVVEEEGIRRARAEIDRADHVLYVIDATSPAGAADPPAGFGDVPPAIPVTWVLNKIDLLGGGPDRAMPEAMAGRSCLRLSAQTGEGIDLLRRHLKACAGYGGAESGVLSARRRHLDALNRAQTAARRGADALLATRAFELFAEDLRLAQQHLSEITGEFSSDDLLGRIFGSFCIGK